MTRKRLPPRNLPVVHETPFANGEEAWMWYIRAERLRRDGAKMGGAMPVTARPCEPDDIYRSLMGLYGKKIITRAHLKVLATFGWNDRAPDARVGSQKNAAMLWDQGLDRLDAELRGKGIVGGPCNEHAQI